jgi:hypothetical protein
MQVGLVVECGMWRAKLPLQNIPLYRSEGVSLLALDNAKKSLRKRRLFFAFVCVLLTAN